MSDIVALNIDDIAPYEGPHAIPGVRFRAARAAVGVSAWGMNVIELDPHNTGYPEHDHEQDGQEELYVVLDGAAVLHANGAETPVRRGDLVRVGPSVTRKFVTGEQGVRLLALGGTPGKAYEPSGL